MILNIVKNGLSASCIDIEVTGKNKLHSLEGLKELEYYFKDYDIRIW